MTDPSAPSDRSAQDARRGPATDVDPMDFVSELVSISLEATEESQRQYAALAAAEGRASEGAVDLVVGPAGEVRSIVFAAEPASSTADEIAADILTAYRRAAAEANAAVAESADPSVQAMIAASVPGEVATQRIRDNGGWDEPFEPVSGSGTGRDQSAKAPAAVDDLPADSQFDELLAILDDPDPLAAIERLRSTPGLPRVDLNRSAAAVDAEIRSEIQAISDRGEELAPQLRELRGTARNDDGTITVNAWGGLLSVGLDPEVESRRGEELAESLQQLIADATAEATRKAGELLRGVGFDDPGDQTLVGLTRPTQTRERDA